MYLRRPPSQSLNNSGDAGPLVGVVSQCQTESLGDCLLHRTLLIPFEQQFAECGSALQDAVFL